MKDDVAPDSLIVRFGNAARLLNAPPETVRYWMKKGLLRPVRVGRCLFFERSELARFVAEHRTQ